MSGKLLIENFENLALAPNSVQKLRELVLQLAFQGKLVPPDETDAQPVDLIGVIRNEKENLSAQRLLRQETPLPDIAQSEIPYPLPRNWRWVRLGDIVNYGGAEKVESNEINDEDWVLDLEDIEKDTSRIVQRLKYKDRPSKSSKARFTKGDVLYGKLRPYLNKVVVADSGGYCTTEIVPIHVYKGIASEYLKFALMRRDFLRYVVAKSYGIKMPRLGTDDARRALFPLAPTGEQFRIAEKIHEMMARLDDLESHRQRQAEIRSFLNASALTHLVEAKEPKTFAIHWKRIYDNFDLLYDTPETVGELRKAILQLAVQGKLVPQDPNDEPASTLLEKIRAEKDKLISEKKIRNSEPLPPIKPEEIPYELPKGWEWARLDDLSDNIHYGYTASANPHIKETRLLRITDIQKDKVDWESVPGCDISPEMAESYKLTRGDILIARTGGTIGKSYLVSDTPVNSVFASYLIRVVPNRHCNADYMKLFMGTKLYWDQLYSKSMGTGQPNVNGTSLRSLIVPLPPIEEQKRIILKTDELQHICVDLEIKLQESQTTSQQLMEAVVREVVG